MLLCLIMWMMYNTIQSLLTSSHSELSPRGSIMMLLFRHPFDPFIAIKLQQNLFILPSYQPYRARLIQSTCDLLDTVNIYCFLHTNYETATHRRQMERRIFTINTNDPAVNLAVVQTVVLYASTSCVARSEQSQGCV